MKCVVFFQLKMISTRVLLLLQLIATFACTYVKRNRFLLKPRARGREREGMSSRRTQV